MRRLAFLDLDLTLFDYTLVREEATRAALGTMHLGCEVEEAMVLMNRVLVPYGDLLATVGLPNFRREWKAPELFALLFLMCEGQGLSIDGQDLAGLLSTLQQPQFVDGGSQFRQRKENYELLSQVIDRSQLGDTISKVNNLIHTDPVRTDLHKAINAFDQYLANYAEPLEGVDDLLTNLRSREFEIYIVSEGEEFIQQEKTSLLGLRERTNGTFVSSSCCHSERLLRWLWNSVIESPAQANTRWLKAVEAVYNEVVLYSTKTSSLFRKILHTVLLPDSDRQKFYQKFGWLSEMECLKAEPVYILLFGDRYEKDLQPGIDAFDNTISIRLLAGKYRSTYETQVIQDSRLPQPTATVHSVLEAAEVINNLPAIDELLPARIIAPSSETRHRLEVQQAVEIISSEPIPSWVADQFEGLQRALLGSEST